MHKNIDKIIIPPIKCQGIKTKLIPFISENIDWDTNGIWYEPFLGSDTNIHIINTYKDIQQNKINKEILRDYLQEQGNILSKRGQDFYYEIRKKFNENPNTLDFIFLNRACFNGMMRFNSKGEYNVPYCKKDNRFQRAYITKICNQVDNVQNIIKDKDWTFEVSNYKETILKATPNDFIYLDPPYIGRDTNYYNKWDETDALALKDILQNSNLNFMMSMWKENKYRFNDYIKDFWMDYPMYYFDHFYHLGGKETNRNKIIETIITNKKGC